MGEIGETSRAEVTSDNPLKFTGDLKAAAIEDALRKAAEGIKKPVEPVEEIKQEMSRSAKLRSGLGSILKYVGWQI